MAAPDQAGSSAHWIGALASMHGVQAVRIENLWWLLFWVCSAVFVAVMVATGIAITRKSLRHRRAGRAASRPSRSAG